jgi:5-methylcytosine-specific restriction protein A
MTRRNWDHGGKTTTGRGYGWAHQKMRQRLKREVILCEQCSRDGRTRIGEIADHIIPLSRGGTGERTNLQLLCRDCAAEKDAKDRGKPLKPKRRIGLSGWPE